MRTPVTASQYFCLKAFVLMCQVTCVDTNLCLLYCKAYRLHSVDKALFITNILNTKFFFTLNHIVTILSKQYAAGGCEL